MTAEKKDLRPLHIKNLADLKRHIRLGTELVATAHQYHPDIVGLTRVVTKVQTNGFYSKIKDQPDHKWSTCNHGNQGHNLNCVLSVEHIVYSVTSADLHGVDLIQIKVCCGPSNVALRKIPLVFLIGYQVLNRDVSLMAAPPENTAARVPAVQQCPALPHLQPRKQMCP